MSDQRAEATGGVRTVYTVLYDGTLREFAVEMTTTQIVFTSGSEAMCDAFINTARNEAWNRG